ncbi:MAG: ATP-dependent DNA helicase PcrA [Candidatus Anoxychlamydiales bacterium]|nr:ATP-dependent DNA helicase PcrA [Candidatus Anoxychlamydiales bacterium]NGX35536.1 ATP-dependent DNA helicase PcrA [Candidatus Anoxychlamydiales bacterium]
MNMLKEEKALNPAQKKALDHIEGPLLVLAGAGSGKTRVVTQKIAKLIQIGINPSEILALTFTNKAADEMATRIRALTFKNVLSCTFHSLGAKILRENISNLGYESNFTIYDAEDSLKLLKDCLRSLNLKDDKALLKKIKFKISHLKNDLVELDDTNALSHLTKSEIEAFRLYQNKLKSFNAVDFDDLLYLTCKLLKENTEILTHYQERWPFLLIDEYQDTNLSQYIIAKLLSQKSQNICVVGDPDQSIYSWRGARYQNILNFDKDFKNATIIKLEKNYRSTASILNAANELIKNNPNRFEKNLYTDNKDGEKIKIFRAQTDQMEATFVIEKISVLNQTEKIELQDMAIFYRTNFQSRIFEDILLSKKIPYVIYGGLSFYQRKEIKDVLAFLKLIISNSDFISFSRTINIPKRGFGKTTITKLFFLSEKLNLPIINLLSELDKNPDRFSDIRLNLNQKTNLKTYLKNLFDLRDLHHKKIDLDELISNILSQMKYLDYLKEDPQSFEDRKENIDELITKASLALEENNQTLEKFLEELTLAISKYDNTNEKALKLMTLHNSKGLEFESVFIVGLEEDILPHINSKKSIEEIEEERRLFYVGMTRAKKHLYICSTETRYMFGSVRLSTPSRFLKELPKEYIDDLSQNLEDDFIDAQPIITDTSQNYYPGLKIYHKTFGVGIVQKVYETSLGETLDILFEDSPNTRSLVTKYAKLKTLN